MIYITDQNAFYLRVTAETKAGSQMADVDLSVIKWLVAHFVRRGRSLQSMEIDSQGRAMIYNSGDLAMGVYGVEFNGYYNGQPWRFFEKNVFAIVDQTANAVEPSGEISGVPVYDCTITITLGEEGVPESYVTNAINEHDNDMNAHPYLQERIENAGKVDDVKVNGLSVVDENKEANINITATVDGNIGEPEVDVEQEDGEIRFAFRNMKGEKGETGPEGPVGPRGDSAVYTPDDPDTPDFEMASTTGQSTTKAMTQKAVTDAVINYASEDESLQISADEKYFVIQNGSYSSAQKYKLAFIPVTAGMAYRIKANASNNCQYTFVTNKDNVVNGATVPFADGFSSAAAIKFISANTESLILAPSDAAYFVYYSLYNNVDYSIQSIKICKPINGQLVSLRTEVQNTKDDLDALETVVDENADILEEIDFSSATEIAVVFNGSTWKSASKSRTCFIPVVPNKNYYVTPNSEHSFSYAFLTNISDVAAGATIHYADGYTINRSVSTRARINAPSDAAYLAFYTIVSEVDWSPVTLEKGKNFKDTFTSFSKLTFRPSSFIPVNETHEQLMEMVATGYEQGSTVYGNFFIQANGYADKKITIYNLQTKQKVQDVTLPTFDNPRYHANTISFGQKYDAEDDFPLLYICSGYTDTPSDSESEVYVVRIIGDAGSYTSELVQTIYLDFGRWTEFVVDAENEVAWIEGTGLASYVCVSLPSTAESSVTINTSSNFLDKFNVDSFKIGRSTKSDGQGRFFYKGRIYYASGVPTREGQGEDALYIAVINTLTHCLEAIAPLKNYGLGGTTSYYEPEACFIWNGNIYVAYRTRIVKLIQN